MKLAAAAAEIQSTQSTYFASVELGTLEEEWNVQKFFFKKKSKRKRRLSGKFCVW